MENDQINAAIVKHYARQQRGGHDRSEMHGAGTAGFGRRLHWYMLDQRCYMRAGGGYHGVQMLTN